MHKLVIGMNAKRGFTLIEILVVIIIIGITIGFALLAFGDFGASRRIVFAAEQLANTIKLAQEQAILETSTLGLRIDNTSYQILKFQTTGKWMPISDKGIFKVTYFPKNTVITLKTNSNVTKNLPAIVMEPSGDMTVFTLSVGSSSEPNLANLRGARNGTLLVTGAKSK